MRPVQMGYCKFESLVDGTLDLEAVLTMNEAIDIDLENRHRVRDWTKQ